MHIPNLLQSRFEAALQGLASDPSKLATMIRATANPTHGDYQANCAMPLSKQLGEKDPAVVAAKIVDQLDVEDFCQPPQIVKGFINLTLQDEFITESMLQMLDDPRCLVSSVAGQQAIVIDYSSPNVAKPLHVGHIRSTVIGDSLARVLKFLGYATVTDNHLGDWGTQFGMIIYGYKHFGDPAQVEASPVRELSTLYRLVNQLMDYHTAVTNQASLEAGVTEAETLVANASAAANEDVEAKELKKRKKALSQAENRLAKLQSEWRATQTKIQQVESDAGLSAKAEAHPRINREVLQETAKLHQGDPENLALWKRFLPFCKDEINRIYTRLDVQFDHVLGESFYQPMLADVVEELQQAGLARESDGAMCVFLPDFDAPMIVRKKDGAFLYATTDLATLKYRQAEFDPAEILYVVDSRQSEHFDKLFAVAQQIGMGPIKLVHVKFGTVMDHEGKPMKTRSGDLIGLEGLLDDAVDRARQVVCDPDRLAAFDPPMDPDEQQKIAEAVGIGAIKFADLSHHRSSDYRFNLKKMVSLEGNTSTYVQYSWSRMRAILAKAGMSETDVEAFVKANSIRFTHPAERTLALTLLRFEESLHAVHADYAPNQLVDYLLETAKAYTGFHENCPVIRAQSDEEKATRLLLVLLCMRLSKLGLSLLGIRTVERM